MILEEVKVIVDYREMRTNVIKQLYELGAKIESKPLPVGDFILSDRVCIEKKTTNDFIESLIDGRLFNQAKNLVENFEKPIILVEGDESLYNKRAVHPNAIRGAIAALAIDFRIPIIQTSGEHETALVLYMIASREQLDKKRSINLRGQKKPISMDYLQEFFISGLPGVGIDIARNLLKHFKTIKNIANAKVDELKKVSKVGEIKAKKIKKVFEEKYNGA